MATRARPPRREASGWGVRRGDTWIRKAGAGAPMLVPGAPGGGGRKGLLGSWGEGVLGALDAGFRGPGLLGGVWDPRIGGGGWGDSDSPVGGGLVGSSDALVYGGFRGCLFRSPRLEEWGARTANLKGLRGLAWGLRRARGPWSPCGLQNSESPHVDPRLLRLRGAGSTQVKPSVLPGHSSIHPSIRMPVSSSSRPLVPSASVSPSAPGCGRAHLTFQIRDPWGVGGGGGDGGRPGRQSERVSASQAAGRVRALVGGGRRRVGCATRPAAPVCADARRLPCRCSRGQPAFAWHRLGAKRHLPLPTCWDPSSPHPRPLLAPGTPPKSTNGSVHSHISVYSASPGSTACDTPSPAPPHPVKWPVA
uniref:Uncharacterized protein n=1 Tax=Mustela putorius furo TaxID=9669 RepID=M3Z8Z3_MUSPF